MATKKKPLGHAKADTAFGRELIGSLREVRDHTKGKITLSTRVIEDISTVRRKKTRKRVARSAGK